MSAHTPGPWLAVVNEPKRGNQGLLYGVAAGAKHRIREHVCHVLDGLGSQNPRADCHLIAAAPEMLEALELLVKLFDAHDDGTDIQRTHSARQKVRAVIAKANGEQP